MEHPGAAGLGSPSRAVAVDLPLRGGLQYRRWQRAGAAALGAKLQRLRGGDAPQPRECVQERRPTS